jgi:hypothetical protein
MLTRFNARLMWGGLFSRQPAFRRLVIGTKSPEGSCRLQILRNCSSAYFFGAVAALGALAGVADVFTGVGVTPIGTETCS